MFLSNKFLSRKREENTPEFKKFKEVSGEDKILIDLIKEKVAIKEDNKVLDIGGRDGYISLKLVRAENITIVDPDPDLKFPEKVHSVRKNIQDINLSGAKFDLIIASHVWGDLGRQNANEYVIDKLYSYLNSSGSLVLCYNSNKGFMVRLSEFAKNNLENMRWDYFDESLLEKFPNIFRHNFVTKLNYKTFKDLGACCWMLFATGADNIEETAQKFIPFLKQNLQIPSFDLEQTFVVIRK